MLISDDDYIGSLFVAYKPLMRAMDETERQAILNKALHIYNTLGRTTKTAVVKGYGNENFYSETKIANAFTNFWDVELFEINETAVPQNCYFDAVNELLLMQCESVLSAYDVEFEQRCDY